MKHRGLNKLFARLRGHFWIPCPACGREFGGHEHEGDYLVITEPNGVVRRKAICRDCAADDATFSEAPHG